LCYFRTMARKTENMADAVWEELGCRVAEARKIVGLSQARLAEKIGLDRTAVTKIETGKRTLDSLELSRIASITGRPIDWFVRPRPPAVISRRGSSARAASAAADLLLEDLVADVELLSELGLLKSRLSRRRRRRRLTDPEDAERLAREARRTANIPGGPITDIVDVADALDLLVFVLDLPEAVFAGSYVALPGCGVALVDGSLSKGKLRFTIAHELGHHFLQDEHDTLLDAPPGRSTRERLVNAFTVYFLLPSSDVIARWKNLQREYDDDRIAALHIGQEYGASWTSLCAHLKHIGLIGEGRRRALVAEPPRTAEFLEQGLRLRPEPPPPVLPARFSQAVVRGYRSRRLGESRVLQMLRGSMEPDDLPTLGQVPLEAMHDELDPF